MLCCSHAEASSQRKPAASTADALGRQIEKRYAALKTLSHEMSGKMTLRGPGGEMSQTIFGATVRLARPNRFLIESTVEHIGKEFHSTLVSDGTRLWEYNPDDQKYTEKPLRSALPKDPRAFGKWVMERGASDLSLLLFLSSGVLHQSKAPPRERMTVRASRTTLGDARLAHRFTLGGLGGAGSATLDFDTKDLLLRRTTLTLPLPGGGKQAARFQVVLSFEYAGIVTNEIMLDEIFKFRPPDDATLAAGIQPVLARAMALDTSEIPIPEKKEPEKPKDDPP